jgi:galactosamine-6-phosphate isomerase
LGKNGHLALNEPGSKVIDSCRIVSLASSSTSHPMLNESANTVNQGITIGLKEILESREIFLIIAGEGKKEAYKMLMKRAPVEDCPASAIFEHERTTLFIDESILH